MAQTKTLKRRLYNVAAATNYLLEKRHSSYIRAIKLYETQIAVFFGEKLNARRSERQEFPERWLAVSSDLLAGAGCAFIGPAVTRAFTNDPTDQIVLSLIIAGSIVVIVLVLGLRSRDD